MEPQVMVRGLGPPLSWRKVRTREEQRLCEGGATKNKTPPTLSPSLGRRLGAAERTLPPRAPKALHNPSILGRPAADTRGSLSNVRGASCSCDPPGCCGSQAGCHGHSLLVTVIAAAGMGLQ